LPLYDYQCRTCRTTTEVRHGSREVHEGVCPSCGGELARVFTPAAIAFKGSGFYINDSRKADGSSSSKSSDSAPAATASTPAAAPSTPAAPAPASDSPKKSETAA
jgi:putative FmdB family regulatory protein